MARRSTAPAGESKKVLIVFLVFFILSTIGGGVAAYYGFAEQEKFVKAAADEKKKALLADEERDSYRFQVAVLTAFLIAKDDPKLPLNEQVKNALALKKDFDDGKLFVGKPNEKEFRAIVAELVKEMPWDNDPAKNWTTKQYKAVLEEKVKSIDDLKLQNKNNEIAVAAVRKKAEADRKVWLDEAKKFYDDTLKEEQDKFSKDSEGFKAKIDELTKQVNAATAVKDDFNAPLRKQIADLAKEKADLNKDLKAALDRNNELEKAQKAVAAASASATNRTTPIEVRGSIVRVLNTPYRVSISLGKKDGLTEQTTFSVHGLLPTGKPDPDRRKADLEVVLVGAETSEALIKYVPSRTPKSSGGRKVIDLDSVEYNDPVVIGDVLINPAWNPNAKTHIAFAGMPDFEGTGAVDMVGLERILNQQNIIVDAYVDPRDGKPVGKGVTPRTDFIVEGIFELGPKAPKDLQDEFKKNATQLKIDADKFKIRRRGSVEFFHQMGFRPNRTTTGE